MWVEVNEEMKNSTNSGTGRHGYGRFSERFITALQRNQGHYDLNAQPVEEMREQSSVWFHGCEQAGGQFGCFSVILNISIPAAVMSLDTPSYEEQSKAEH